MAKTYKENNMRYIKVTLIILFIGCVLLADPIPPVEPTEITITKVSDDVVDVTTNSTVRLYRADLERKKQSLLNQIAGRQAKIVEIDTYLNAMK